MQKVVFLKIMWNKKKIFTSASATNLLVATTVATTSTTTPFGV
jgi:hypothetical protein